MPVLDNPWITVQRTRKLPKFYSSVLIYAPIEGEDDDEYCADLASRIPWKVGGNRNATYCWLSATIYAHDGIRHRYRKNEVTHWMPVPRPPKENNNAST